MTIEDEFWLDRYLYEIPLLTCGDDDLDYPAIMSRFHYLLLKRDKSTHKEFVKCWAILIITAPDVFDSDKDKHFKELVFSRVEDSAIKLDRPIEKIQLPPGRPKLEPADHFWYGNWKPLFDRTYSRTDMDDLAVYRWYTNPANTWKARSFFGVYCMLLLRAYTDESSTVTSLEEIVLHSGKYTKVVNGCSETLSRKPITAYAPGSRISFNLNTAAFLRDAFETQYGTYTKVLRIVLDWNENHLDRDGKCDLERRFFFEKYVRPYLIYYGLSIMNFAETHLVNIETWLKLKSTCEDTGSEKLLLAVKAIDDFEENFNGIRLQDGTFLKQKPHFKGQNCRFWPYSRLFSTLKLKSLGDENNQEFLAFCLGYKNLDKDLYSNHYRRLLRNFMY